MNRKMLIAIGLICMVVLFVVGCKAKPVDQPEPKEEGTLDNQGTVDDTNMQDLENIDKDLENITW